MIGNWLPRIVLLGVLLAGTAPAEAQVAVGTVHGSISYGSSGYTRVNGWVAYIDLTSHLFIPVVTEPAPPPCTLPKGTVLMQRTNRFASLSHTLVAITANTGPETPPEGACATPDGLIISDGVAVNPAQEEGPVLFFDANGNATIVLGTPVSGVARNAVAGTTTTGNDCGGTQLGTLLVKEGEPGACPIPKSTVIAPRGAIGLDKDGTTLIFAIIVGVEDTTGHKTAIGLKTADFAKLMIGLGAYNAVNFDGGGSTAFIWSPPADPPAASPRLVQMIEQAAFPHHQLNPYNLNFSGSVKEVGKPHISNSRCTRGLKGCDSSNKTFRPVYAGFGLRFLPGTQK